MKVLAAILVVLCGGQAVAEKSPLKVLFVGQDPQAPRLAEFEQHSKFQDRLLALHRGGTPAFEAFLREHFETVGVVHADDYAESMSAGHDVTIFRALPKPLREGVVEREPETGRILRHEPAVYLSPEFDHAAILIAENSALVAEGHGYKMDWLCLCLDAHAHGLKADHPIFNTPHPVALTYEQFPVPKYYRMFYSGRDLPPSLPMWRVQLEGYSDGKGFPAGLVSSPWGFADAPDAEVISAGVNTKSVDAVALGRHGNFFHWGFSAAPDQMTSEGRLVFLNAIHYMARFNGHKPYSRRSFRRKSREALLEFEYFKAHRGADNRLSWYASNLEYLMPGERPGEYVIDEDARSLGESNRSIALLERCVSLMESGSDTARAERLLLRYTGESRKTAGEWRAWLERHRERLYFSDVDRYRFELLPQ